MKKTYTKPEIMFEDFKLSTNIAAGCETKTSTPSLDQCGYAVPGVGVIFIQGVNGCTKKIESGEFNGLCYHNPTELNNLFNS